MEESQLSVLTPDLAAEAQTLRREFETRSQHLLSERITNVNSFSSVLRRLGPRFSRFPRTRWGNWSTGNGDPLPGMFFFLFKCF